MLRETTSGCGDVCELSEERIRDRIELTRNEILPRARGCETVPGGVVWSFPASRGLRARLCEWVDFERECCSGLRFALSDPGEVAEPIRLRIETRDGSELPAIFAAPLETQGTPDNLKRVLRAGAVGFGGALFLCCVVPIALGALVGGSLASRLSVLADTRLIAAAGVASGLGVWFWERHRRSQRVAGHSDPCGC